MKASIFIGTSLDGFIARSNGDLDFLPPGGGERRGKWFRVRLTVGSAWLEPTVADQCWVPAYGEADAPTIWFFFRRLLNRESAIAA